MKRPKISRVTGDFPTKSQREPSPQLSVCDQLM